jgi:adenylosuccinate synthase
VSKRIILLSGRVASGKSTLAQGLADRFGMLTLKTRDLLEERLARRGRKDRRNLQAEGDRLDRRTGGKWVREELDRRVREGPENALILVDSVRILNQIDGCGYRYQQVY